MDKRIKAVCCAVLAALLYAINSPFSKLLLLDVQPAMMASLLYLGAGIGMLLLAVARRGMSLASDETGMTRKDLPYVLGMIVLDILAPVFLMMGLQQTTAANASLLNNFEIVATSLIAFFLFRERISGRLAKAIALIVLSSILLSVEDVSSFRFSLGSVYVLLACCCWGMENNCTRMLSQSDPQQIVIVKGLGSGAGSLLVACIAGESLPPMSKVSLALLLGFVAYGLSIYFYVYAQHFLGAACTSAYYAVAPFIGVLLSLMIFRELPGWTFFAALVLMAAGTWLVTMDQMQEG